MLRSVFGRALGALTPKSGLNRIFTELKAQQAIAIQKRHVASKGGAKSTKTVIQRNKCVPDRGTKKLATNHVKRTLVGTATPKVNYNAFRNLKSTKAKRTRAKTLDTLNKLGARHKPALKAFRTLAGRTGVASRIFGPPALIGIVRQILSSDNPIIFGVPYQQRREAIDLMKKHLTQRPAFGNRYYLVANTGPKGSGKTVQQAQNMITAATVTANFSNGVRTNRKECVVFGVDFNDGDGDMSRIRATYEEGSDRFLAAFKTRLFASVLNLNSANNRLGTLKKIFSGSAPPPGFC